MIFIISFHTERKKRKRSRTNVKVTSVGVTRAEHEREREKKNAAIREDIFESKNQLANPINQMMPACSLTHAVS
jgi:hypothetical protein